MSFRENVIVGVQYNHQRYLDLKRITSRMDFWEICAGGGFPEVIRQKTSLIVNLFEPLEEVVLGADPDCSFGVGHPSYDVLVRISEPVWEELERKLQR